MNYVDYITIYHRKRAYFTQASLAETLGISKSYNSQIECGRVEISLKQLYHIAETINVDVTMLLADLNSILKSYEFSEFIEIIRNWTSAKMLREKKNLCCIIYNKLS